MVACDGPECPDCSKDACRQIPSTPLNLTKTQAASQLIGPMSVRHESRHEMSKETPKCLLCKSTDSDGVERLEISRPPANTALGSPMITSVAL